MNIIPRRANLALACQCALASAGLVFSASHLQANAGDLFASDPNANVIRVYALDGSTRVFARGLNSPQGLAFDSFGNLFAADKGSGRIYKFAVDGSRTTFATGLHDPIGIAFDGTQLAVAESGTAKVTFLGQSGLPTVSENFPNPLGLTFQTPNLYLAGNDELNVIDSMDVITTTAISGSRAVAVDNDGNAFVSSLLGTVTRVGTNSAITTFASGLTTPNGMAFRPKRYSNTEAGVGDLFVAETASGEVSEFAPDGVRKVFASGGNPKFLAFELILPGKLLNISTRLNALTGDDVLIGGFIVTGDVPKQVLLRAIGPSLSEAETPVSGALMDTVLELHKPDGSVVVNDDWKSDQKADINATGIAPTDDRESAMLVTLDPGAYTAIVHGKNAATGIAMVEAYDLAPDDASELGNISTRGFVQSGDDCMIGGFIIDHAQAARILIRALGKSLAQAAVSVPNPLQDPTLELRDANGDLINFNDNWADTAEGEITATGIAPTNPKEAAILINLQGGDYTAIVRGADGGTGVALVEIYHLP